MCGIDRTVRYAASVSESRVTVPSVPPALQAMATATGGEAFQAVEPADIAGVFAQAVLARSNPS
jgi:hypothetical protein